MTRRGFLHRAAPALRCGAGQRGLRSRSRWRRRLRISLGAIGSGAFARRSRSRRVLRSFHGTDGGRADSCVPAGPRLHGAPLEHRAIEEYGGHDPRMVIPSSCAWSRSSLRRASAAADRRRQHRPRVVAGPGGSQAPRGVHSAQCRTGGRCARDLVRVRPDARGHARIDLEADSGASARVEATRLVSAIGRRWVQALELGNEPELYSAFTWYHVHGPEDAWTPTRLNIAEYLREFSRIAQSLPRLPLAGPAAGSPKWMRYVGRFIAAEPRVRTVTLHRFSAPTAVTWHPAPAVTRRSGICSRRPPRVVWPTAWPEIRAGACARAQGPDRRGQHDLLWSSPRGGRVIRLGAVGPAGTVRDSLARARRSQHPHLWARPTRCSSSTMTMARGAPLSTPSTTGCACSPRRPRPGSRLLSVRRRSRAGVQAWATRAPGGRSACRPDQHRSARAHAGGPRPQGGSARPSSGCSAKPSALGLGVTIGGQSFTAN